MQKQIKYCHIVVSASLPFAIKYILNAGLGDYRIITFEPLVFVLADEAGVVAAL